MNATDNEIVGGIEPLNLTEAEEELNISLTKLAAGTGPSFKLDKIHSATTQVVAGTSHKIVADLVNTDGVTRKCDISIWSRPWLKDGIEITFQFEGEEKIIRKYSL